MTSRTRWLYCLLAGLAVIATILPGKFPWMAAAAAQSTESGTENKVKESGGKSPQPGDVELKSSRVYTFVGKTGLGHEHAVEGWLKSGQLRLGAARDAGRLEFDLRTFQADTGQARQYLGLRGRTDQETARKVTSNMLGADVLDTGRFPVAVFEVTTALPHTSSQPARRGTEYLLEGEFSLHGVKRPLKLVAVAEAERGWIRLRGQFAIRQTDFGITPFSTALGAVGITNELSIYGDLWLVPDPAVVPQP